MYIHTYIYIYIYIHMRLVMFCEGSKYPHLWQATATSTGVFSAQAVRAGAQFIVSPGLNPEAGAVLIFHWLPELGVSSFGVGTPFCWQVWKEAKKKTEANLEGTPF